MENMCPQCGAPLAAGTKKCEYCGAVIEQPKTAQQTTGNAAPAGNGQYLNGQNKWVMAVIAFFLGGFGVHNFMLGETKKGILRLVLSVVGCGIGGILALIDLILILTDKYVVDANKFFI